MSWTHAICDACWLSREPYRNPYRLAGGDQEMERCCFCDTYTFSRIYVRENPTNLPLCRGHDDD